MTEDEMTLREFKAMHAARVAQAIGNYIRAVCDLPVTAHFIAETHEALVKAIEESL